ncbi:putative Galanin [Tolypothrix sp. NIES-4075]|uniref:DUF3137 domain-containing protein n=1 Tax=Tolypothrix sp. NIES-4075 TaxID=2005459 RepID=UPI000B5CF2F9|nr:DUF3137 domain-containing protein [Tolypothrix sp. NIES-4075]GAX44495.1 putative Galanin [Tolypothrix sp. NIES-4075]
MSSFEALQSGLEAIKQGRYSEGINLLENFCQCELTSKTVSKEYLQAQISLVKAYHCTGKREKARVLCSQLAESKNLQVQSWAQRIMPSLSAESSVTPENLQPETSSIAPKIFLSSEEATKLLAQAYKALKFRRYIEAIQVLEEFCQRSDANTKDYSQAQMWLVKAYKANGQLDNAIALLKQLTTSEQQATQIWAQQFILTLLPESEVPSSATESTTCEQNQPTSTPKQATAVKMRTLSEFKNFCQENLINDLKATEATRKEVLKSISFVGIILLIIVGFLIKFFPTEYIIFCLIHKISLPFLIIFIFLFGFLGCLWIWVAFYTSATETYTSGFKSKIIEKIFDFINTDKNLSYSSCSSDADRDYTMSGFIHSQLFQNLLKPNKITQNECIFGKLHETPIFFSEICAEVEVHHAWAKYLDFPEHIRILNSFMIPRFITRRIFVLMLPLYTIILLIKCIKALPYIVSRMLKGQKIDYQHFEEEVFSNKVSRKSLFKGLFFSATFPKNSKSKTLIIPKLMNSNIHSLNIGKKQIIKLEDPEFTKFFTVYGNDQVEARYILSTNLMAKLVNFRKKAGRNIYVSFVDNMIYIAIEYAEDVFEPKLFKTMLSFAPMREYFENIQLMLGIVEDLNLNRHIWSQN